MPLKRNSQEPPQVMTWAKATPILVISIVFDALRIVFVWFVFFGPALAAIACTAKVSGVVSTITLGLAGTKTTAAGCAVAASVAGFFGAAPIAAFGMIMAMAVGFAGWLLIGIIILVSNARILKKNFLGFVGSLMLSEIPFVNSFPAFTVITWRMYHHQIKTEKEELAEWKKKQAATQMQEQQQQAGAQMQVAQMQAAQQAQAEQEAQLEDQEAQQVEQEAQLAEEEIPDESRKAT